jgi:hypothetical protein
MRGIALKSVFLKHWSIPVAVALLLAAASAYFNREWLCSSRQWTSEQFCPEISKDPTVRIQTLERRIKRNPGDSEAWIQLAIEWSTLDPVGGRDSRAVLDGALKLAPNDHRLKRLQARRALMGGDFNLAIGILVNLVQDLKDAQSATALAGLMQYQPALDVMIQRVQGGADWLVPVLQASTRSKIPVDLALPIVARAIELKLYTPEIAQAMIPPLKARGLWHEAYALWLAWQNKPIMLPFNGSFDNGFTPNGFDWELGALPSSRIGVRVGQPEVEDHGRVLELDFIGRNIPNIIVRQPMLLTNPRYSFIGEYRTKDLKTREGLSWAVLCGTDGTEVARSTGLLDTEQNWRPFKLDFELPSKCNMLAILQLQPRSEFDAVAGMRGQIQIDNLRLESKP